MGFWKTFAACLLAVVVSSILSILFSLMIFVGMIASLASFEGENVVVSKKSVLLVDLDTHFTEASSTSPFDGLSLFSMKSTDKISTYDAVRLIEAAAIDPNIEGIYVKISLASPNSLSALYEIRNAISNFKELAPNKFTIAYGDAYSQGALYLSSICDKVYMNPSGATDWRGMSASVMFFKGAMDKLGIEPEIIRHGSFKGAVEPFMLDKMSAENRLQTKSMMESVWGYLVGQIASSRKLDSAALQLAATELNAVTAKDALAAGLVDSLCYRDKLIADLELLIGTDNPKLLTINQYKRSGVLVNYPTDNKVALIYAEGEIIDISDSKGFGGSQNIVGNELAATIRQARQDDKVKAIVLRVNSPGGSVLASDIIYREMYLARQVKPIIVSMGAYGASGGYWIAAPSDAIIAAPMTITGSIGVFGMMFNVEKGAREKLGITVDVVSTNASADIGNMFRPLTSLERTFMQNNVDSIYTKFINLVAAGRDMAVDSVDAIGGGRIWSGLQAINNGLINECGTMRDAIELAAKKAGIEDTYSVKTYSGAPKTIFDIIGQNMQGSVTRIFGTLKSEVALQAEKIEKIVKKQGVQAAMPYKISIDN